MHKLYSRTLLGDLDLRNRVFLAPLTRNRAQLDGTPGAMSAEYYSQRASGGLLITEATQVSPMGQGYIATPGIYTGDQAAEWAKTSRAVHEKGGAIFLQMWHVGRISHSSLLPGQAAPYAPSAIRANGAQVFTASGPQPTSEPTAMTIDQIRSTVNDYKVAAEYAKKAGFDGLEIHGANGYLIDQFIQDKSNKRTDEYGGSVANRMRFLNEVIAAVTSVYPASRVGVRLSPTGKFNDMGDSDTYNTFSQVIQSLNQRGLAYLHMVEKFPGIPSSEHDLILLRKLRDQWSGFYIANGDYSAEAAERAVDSNHADAVAFGRTFLANPDLPKRLEKRIPLNEPKYNSFYGGGAEGYIDYPFAK